jgi:PAS domain S-box-containing protein
MAPSSSRASRDLTAASEPELERLRRRLEEAEETIHAIRTGAVDAFLIEGGGGPKVYALETADRPYRQLVEHMLQGALVLGIEGQVLYTNATMARLLGVPIERLRAARFEEHVVTDDRVSFNQALEQGRHSGAQAEIRLLRANGSALPVHLTASPLPEPSPRLCAVIVTDLTRQKEYEELVRAQRALRESDRRKDDFLATLSHELRNPLGPIRNALHILRTPGGDHHGTRSRIMKMMQRQVEHLVRLVDDLLEVSRIGRGMIELRRERVDLASIVRHALDTHEEEIRAAGHEIAVSIPADPLPCFADPVRIEQVIGNLLSNAIKFTEPGGKISIQVRREAREFVIAVRDTGRGIPTEMQARVFGMFVQLDAHRTNKQGLGIGLTVARSLTEMHGGTVECSSEGPERGSEFIVRLPADEGLALSRPDRHTEQPVRMAAHSQRVLVVDDHEDSTESLGLLLRLMGHDVRLAADGPQALAAAESFRPEIVILDIGLPGMDGYEVAARLRESPDLSGARLIALTGYGQEEDRERSREVGFEAHLVKPIEMESLHRLLGTPLKA